MNEYKQQANPSQLYSANSDYSSRYPEMYPSHKEGGVLKAHSGIIVPTITLTNIQLPDPFADWNRE